MLLAVSEAEAEHGRIAISPNGSPAWRTNYFGTFGAMDTDENPMAFRVDMSADTKLGSHFHEVDQFQLFVSGRGQIGRHTLCGVSVHYADHHTAYGPISASRTGLSYITLRPRQSSGIHYVKDPGSSAHLSPSRKRQYTVSDVPLSIGPVMAERRRTQLEALFAPQADGLAAYVLRLGSLQAALLPVELATGSLYIWVANGTGTADCMTLPRNSLMWTDHAAGMEIRAGREGMEAMVLRFPDPQVGPPADGDIC